MTPENSGGIYAILMIVMLIVGYAAGVYTKGK